MLHVCGPKLQTHCSSDSRSLWAIECRWSSSVLFFFFSLSEHSQWNKYTVTHNHWFHLKVAGVLFFFCFFIKTVSYSLHCYKSSLSCSDAFIMHHHSCTQWISEVLLKASLCNCFHLNILLVIHFIPGHFWPAASGCKLYIMTHKDYCYYYYCYSSAVQLMLQNQSHHLS